MPHTELTILAWWGSRMLSTAYFYSNFAYTPCIIFATSFIFDTTNTIDLLAGAATAGLLIVLAPVFLRQIVCKARPSTRG